MQNEAISNARKVLSDLLDDRSFVEILENYDKGVIGGYGTINLRPVCIFVQDSSVDNGAVTEKNCEKISRIIDMAIKNGVPLIGVYDSIGVKIDESSKVFLSIKKMLSKMAEASGVIPQFGVCLGNSVGVNSFAINFSDFVFMVDNKSKMFLNGPQNMIVSEGKEISAEELGGAKTHFENSGMCHIFAENDSECVEKIKELLSYLPDNNLADVCILESDDLNRECEELNSGVESNREIILAVCDDNKFFELQSGFGKSIAVGFARFGGRSCGVIANVDKMPDTCSIDKATRFIRFCDAFNMPIVTFSDVEGAKVSIVEERNGISKKIAGMIFAYSDAVVPKINIVTGSMFGGVSLAMGIGADITLAWDSAKISVALPKVAVNVMYNNEIADSENPVEYREEKLKDYLENEAIPSKAENTGFIDGVISPSETRKRIINALELYVSKRGIKINKRHGNMPF